MVTTLAEIFLNTVKTYPKPDFMLVKREGRYAPISTQEFGEPSSISPSACTPSATPRATSSSSCPRTGPNG